MIKIRVRGVSLKNNSFGSLISDSANLIGMTAWTISPYSVTLHNAKNAAWIDLARALNGMARKIGGRIKCAATPGYHYEIVVPEAAAQRRAA